MTFLEEQVKPEDFYIKTKTEIENGAYLIGVVGNDERGLDASFSIRYFFLNDGALKSFCLKTGDKFPSLSFISPCAKLYEREIKSLFGLIPENHPDPRPLMLYPENWDPGVYPLRKDYDRKKPVIKSYGDYHYKKVEGEGIYEIPVGPIHAGVIEPGHFRFSLSGEPILQLETRHFWKHRGVEKICEGKSLEDALTIIGKISGDNNVNITLAYLNAVESLLGVEIPERAKFIRVILGELERIWNHVRDFGWLFMDIGFALPAQGLFSLQEELMRLNRLLTGHRFMFGSTAVGGVSVDLNKEGTERIKALLTKVRNEVTSYEEFALNSPSVMDRFETTGRVFKETATELSLCGVCARASALKRDTRVELPYLVYGSLDIDVPVFEQGDVFARLMVRVNEIYESIKIVMGLVDNLPEGLLKADSGTAGPYRMEAGNAETPRGNAFFFLMTDDMGKIYRLKYVDPSFRNWPAIQYAVIGDIIADFPLVNKSMNLSYSGNDM